MIYEYIPHGVCTRHITIEYEGNIIKDVKFEGGCSGNTQGVSALIKGMEIKEAISRLENIHCGFKSTSCPDQLAKALKLLNKKDEI